jgi:LysM repeat protein
MKKHFVLITIFLFTALIFSACTKSASTPPPVTPTTNLSEIARQATQTAIAKTPVSEEPGEVDETTEVTDQTPAAEETQAEVTDAPEATEVPEETAEAKEITSYAVPSSYTLKEGEFPFCLARRFNINVVDILNLNGLEEGEILYPGTTLQIPTNGRTFLGDRALRFHPDTYTVSPGETLHSIACLYGDVDPRAIAQANDIDINQTLTSGQTLEIP